jgi:hypothetical protein
MVDQLVAQGYRIGASYGTYVWVIDEHGFALFSSGVLVTTSERPPEGVATVRVHYARKDRGTCGVGFVLASGETELVIEERDVAGDNIAYSETDHVEDTRWALYIGVQLALWCGVPLDDEASNFEIDADLAIMRASRTLAGKLADTSAASELVESMGTIGRATELAFRFVPASGAAKATLELRVTSKKGATRTTPPIKLGTTAQVAAFLRRVTTPATVQFAMNDTIRALKAEGLA